MPGHDMGWPWWKQQDRRKLCQHGLCHLQVHQFVVLILMLLMILMIISTARCSRWTRLLSRIPSIHPIHPSIHPPTYSLECSKLFYEKSTLSEKVRKCESESVKVKVWKWKCESESVKVKVWKWKWKCESESKQTLRNCVFSFNLHPFFYLQTPRNCE